MTRNGAPEREARPTMEVVLFAGCGDLGMRAARRALARGHEVWALRRNPPGDAGGDASDGSGGGMGSSGQAGGPGIRWLRGDLSDPATLAALPRHIDRLAYLPAPGGRSEDLYRSVFIDGLRHVLARVDAGRLRRLVFVSSSAVYGEHGGDWVDEDTPEAPQGFNGRILLEAERWLAAQGLPAVRLRLAGLYGPGRLQLIERLRAGAARAPRHPPHWANRMHIDDAAAAVDHLLHLPDALPVYLGCDDTPLPLHALYAHLARLVGAPEPAEGPAPAGVGSKRLRNARLRASGSELAWPDARAGYAALLGGRAT